MAVSRRREPEATTLTLTIPACSVSRKPGAVQFQLEVSRGTIRYSSLWNRGQSLAIADVGRAEVEAGLLKYGDRFRPPIRLVLHPKDAAGRKPIVINTKVFRKEDIRRLFAILEEQGLLPA